MPTLARKSLLYALSMTLTWLAAPAHANETTDIKSQISRGDLTGALARAAAGVTANPRDVQLRFLQGVALMDLRRDEEARAVFTLLTQEYPELPDPYNNIALLDVRAGRLEAAQQSLEAALRSDPSHRAARSNLGQVHLMLAVQSWEIAMLKGPIDPLLQRRLDAVRELVAAPAAPGR